MESQPWTWLLVVKLLAAAVTLAAPFIAVAIPKNDPDHRHVANVGSQSR